MELGASENREKGYSYVLRRLELGRWFIRWMTKSALILLNQCFLIMSETRYSLTSWCSQLIILISQLGGGGSNNYDRVVWVWHLCVHIWVKGHLTGTGNSQTSTSRVVEVVEFDILRTAVSVHILVLQELRSRPWRRSHRAPETED